MQQSSELLAIAGEITREFPLVLDRTGLVLYDVDPGHLQAQWQVTPEDFARARSAFPAGAKGVRPVLRLLRVDAGNQAKPVESLPQVAGGQGMTGSARFAVDAQGASFVSELGIESADGGWLLLARSNRVQLPRFAGRPTPTGMDARRGWENAPAPLPDALPRFMEQPIRAVAGVPSDRQSVAAVRASAGEPPAEVAAAPADPTLAAAGAPLEPVFPLPGRDAAGFPGGAPALYPTSPAGEATGRQAAETGEAGHPAGQTAALGAPRAGTELPPPLLPSTWLGLAAEGPLGLTFYDPRAAMSSRELQRPVSPPPDLEIHAEILVYGRAAPGGLIDVFGYAVRVGPDGRFSVRRRLDDPLALFGALATPPVVPPAQPDTP